MTITIEIAPELERQIRRKYVSIAALDPVTGETVPLYHPRRNRWPEQRMVMAQKHCD